MNENLDSNPKIKFKILNYYNHNKIKILLLICIITITAVSFSILKINNSKKNILIAEKYVEAGINSSSKNLDKARVLYEEIILSKNKFYSILALNAILEKDLILDENKILNYFEVLENSISSKENKDIIKLKKALYLIKLSKIKEGNDLLRGLIEQDSNLKTIAEELLKE